MDASSEFSHTIMLSIGENVTVLYDAGDYALVSQYDWKFSGGYARVHRGARTILMHRLILGLEKGNSLLVDHINGCGWDNRRRNLRICTDTGNAHNRRKSLGYSSDFKGVSISHGGKWAATIHVNRTQHHLGLFVSEIEAAKAYDAAATELHGEFAKLNFPEYT